MNNAPDKGLLVITASNGENLKLAERCVHAASQRQAQAELIDLEGHTPGQYNLEYGE